MRECGIRELYVDGISGTRIAPQMDIHRELYMPDGLHPNDMGQGLIAAKLKGFLQSL